MVYFIHEGEKMINTQFIILPSYRVLTRINVSRFAIILFVALLALWQDVVSASVPNSFISGQSTISANVAEGTSETNGNLTSFTDINEIIKTGGVTWIINKGLIYVSNIASAPIFDLQIVDLCGAGAAAARLVMHEDAALTLSGNNAFTGQYLVRRGALHILTEDAIASNVSVKIDDATNSALEYNVKSGTKRLDLIDGKAIKGSQVGSSLPFAGNYGKIEKTGSGTLPINSEADGSVKVKKFAIVSGRVDYQGYFDSFVRSGIDVQDGAAFSPGLSNSDTIGNAILGSAITLAFGTAALFEFDSRSDDPDSRLFDAITIDKNSRSDSVQFKPQSGAFLKLAYLGGDADKLPKKGAILLISDERTDRDPGASPNLNDDCIYRMANQKDIFEF